MTGNGVPSLITARAFQNQFIIVTLFYVIVNSIAELYKLGPRYKFVACASTYLFKTVFTSQPMCYYFFHFRPIN
jgi:hypothetical protein